MRCLCVALLATGLGVARGSTGAGPQPLRDRLSWDGGWEFRLGDPAGAEAPAFADGSWGRVQLPHDWSIEEAVDHKAPAGGGGGYFPTGVGWYRRHFRAPEAWRGRRASIEFDGVYEDATVWINGHRLGTHGYGYTEFSYDLSPYLDFAGDNVLAVRVDNSAQPNCRWYSGSGIYRHVWLELTGPVHLAPDGVFVWTAEEGPGRARVRVSATVLNDSDVARAIAVDVVVAGPDGRKAAAGRLLGTAGAHASCSAVADMEMGDPFLWSPEHPDLYQAGVRVLADGQAADEERIPFGVRTVSVSADRGFLLNGRPMSLDGGAVHHDNGPLGAAAFDRAEERRVQLLKAAGFQLIRTSHNPPSPAFLDACDRFGMLVLDEAFDGWARSKLSEDYGKIFAASWPDDLASMVLRDRNHPCVVMWSIGNEMGERGMPEGRRTASEMVAEVRSMDATRPVTAALNDIRKPGDFAQADPMLGELDVAGYNYLIPRYAADHARVPGRVILATESYQKDTFAGWLAVSQDPYVIGDVVWTAMDYLGESGIGRVFAPGERVVKHYLADQFPWHGAACGSIDLTGWLKPAGHYRRIVWDRGERLYLSVVPPTPDGRPWQPSWWACKPGLPSWSWPGAKGRTLEVDVFSRHDSVRLYLNGILVGEKPTGEKEQYQAAFMVPYAPGRLEARGVDAGRPTESTALETAGPVSRLRLSADRTLLRSGGEDLAFVTVELCDARGRLQTAADRPISFRLLGPATIAAIANADLTTMETYQANPHRTFEGRALVIVRTGAGGGTIHLYAVSAGLPAASLALRSTPNPDSAALGGDRRRL